VSEPAARIKDALSQVQTPWDAARTERTLSTLPQARRKKRLRKTLVIGLECAALAAAVWLFVAPREGQPPHDASQPVAVQPTQPTEPVTALPETHDSQLLRLADGSNVSMLEAHTDVAVDSVSEQLVSLHLHRGRARFEVAKRAERLFRVRTAQVTVEVLGTIFEVEQRAGRTWVQVTRGRVAVLWADQRQELVAGSEGLFPPTSDAALRRADSQTQNQSQSQTQTQAQRRAARSARRESDSEARTPNWRDHAEGGDFKQAFQMLPKADTMGAMDVSELLLAADAARLSGHPHAALPFLERVVKAHPSDARAPLAAFTLGGVLMHQLGLPREAEAAYAKARATTKSVALAQDALARQVEAAHQAGDATLARQLAREYLAQYPDGRRIHAVRRFGRL